jgi:hypothetical protein
MNTAGAIGSVLVALVIGIIGLLLERRDKRKAAERENKEHPANPDGLKRAFKRVCELREKARRNL